MTRNNYVSPEADSEDADAVTWEDSYAIALALRQRHPNVSLVEISHQMLYLWTIELPGFKDDPALANENILNAILQEWFEEANPL